MTMARSESHAERSIDMARTKTWLVSGLVSMAFFSLASPSRAQDAAGAGAAAGGTSGSGDYGYKFEDDPLSAGGFGPADATIRVRPGPVRTTLIRPRTSFVPEMLKSVENI